MANKIPGNRQISGNWGQVWWDGDLVLEASGFEAKATPEREDVPLYGGDIDSKMTGVKCEGTLKYRKVFSRGVKKLLKSWQEGRDIRSQFVGKLADPDAYGSERVVIDNVWFNELILMAWARGEKLEEEMPFGYTLSSVDFPDTIDPQ